MKNILYFLFFITVSYKVTAQITYIPDPLFEQELITQDIDSDGIVNGQILTSDALAITSLTLYYVNAPNEYIEDLTGLEDFVNLESLTVNGTMVEELDISTLVNLKYLNCVDNMLTSIDVSNNTLLEYLEIKSGGDVYPINNITEIDLSNNPNIHTVRTTGYMNKIILSNGNNNPNMYIKISAPVLGSTPETGYVCIEVDDVELAQNNQYPYSDWTVVLWYMTYNYTDDAENCALNIISFEENKISIYPNPVSDMLYFEATDTIIEKIMVFDLSGRKILEQNQVNNLSVSDLQKGNYILKIVSDKGIQTEKIIVK
ncbi:MAG TPA: T9SS type A sorting domain-containing protein [Flavobacterium sp.]|nr:T9SS type A sorting domain-containing protein [Flavobacterium sp.]